MTRRRSVIRLKSVLGVALIVVVGAGAVVVRSQQPRAMREWRYYGADHAFTRYSPLDQVTRDNVKNLKVAWRRPAVNSTLTDAFPELRVNPYLKSTPIVVDGVVYWSRSRLRTKSRRSRRGDRTRQFDVRSQKHERP
jgi:glucose dehydrogenase